MSNNDCGPGGCMPDGLTMQVDEFTMENNRPNTPNDGLTVANVFEKASQMQKRVLDGIPSVKEKLCGMWNAMATHARWRSDATGDVVLKSTESRSIASNSKTTSGELEILIEKPGKCDKPPLNAKSIGDAHGAENIIARRILAANQTLSALTTLANYAWICTFLGWMVSEILAALCRSEMPEIGGLLDGDQDLYKYYINQISMKLETLVATIIPPLYAVSSVLVAIVFTNVILFSTGSKSVTPPHSSDTASSIPPATPTSIIPTAWASRVVAWTTNAAATFTSKIRSTALSWWSSKLMATIQLLVFWILYALSVWSHGVTVTVDPGFLPENEWPYSGDPFRDDHFILYHTSSTSDVLGRSHTSGTSPVFDSVHALGSTQGSFHPIVTSRLKINMNGNADRMINMRGRYLWYWDDEETRLWVAKQWEESANSVNNEKAAEHDKSTRRSKRKKNPKALRISPENGVSNTLVSDMVTTNTTAARLSNPFHNSFDKESSDADMKGEISDAGISLNFGADVDVRDTRRPIASGEDRKTRLNQKQVNYAIMGKNGELTDHSLSLHDQKMLYKMAVNHYFDTVFSDNDRMLASGILETSEFTNYISLNSTAYVAGSSSAGFINSAGHVSTGHMSDPAGYIHRHGGTQPDDYDPTRYVQHPIKLERFRPIPYNPTRPIQYDAFRRIFVPYGAKYSGIYGKYIVGLQTYPPLMMKWISGFIGKPIGFRNQKAFSLFLLYSGMLSCYVLIVLGGKMFWLICNLKSLALIKTKESKSLDGSLNRGLLQKSSRKDQMSPEMNEDLTGQSTKNEVKISISDRKSNNIGIHYMTTSAEVAFDTTSRTVSLKINDLFKSYYPSLVVLGWCLLHGMCFASMMRYGLWNGQHGLWRGLNSGIGSPYTGNVHSVMCSLLPHEACLERNAIQDYVMANKDAAFAEIQDPNTEYPSNVSNHVYASSRRVSTAQSLLQVSPGLSQKSVRKTLSEMGNAVGHCVEECLCNCIGTSMNSDSDDHDSYSDDQGNSHRHANGRVSAAIAFEAQTPTGQWCTILADLSVPDSRQVPAISGCTICDPLCCPKTSELEEVFKKFLPRHLNDPPRSRIQFNQSWKFVRLGNGASGVAFHFASEPPGIPGQQNHCTDFVTKIIKPGEGASISQHRLRELGIESLRKEHPGHVYAPLYPLAHFAELFGKKDTVTFMRFGAGGNLLETLEQQGKHEFLRVFFKELWPLMHILSQFNSGRRSDKSTGPPSIHRDIKPGNLVFTSTRADVYCRVAIIDWDDAIEVAKQDTSLKKRRPDIGTPLFMSVICVHADGSTKKCYLRANDQYALVLTAALTMQGMNQEGMPVTRAPQQYFGTFSGDRVYIFSIPELFDRLETAATRYPRSFPKVRWGSTQHNSNVYDLWTTFILSYLVLWDINTVKSRGRDWAPPAPCFGDRNHQVVTFMNLMERPNPSTGSNDVDICGKHWSIAHSSIRCLSESRDSLSSQCEQLVSPRMEEPLRSSLWPEWIPSWW